MKTLVSKLVWPAYFAGLIFLSYAGFDAYRNASSILQDHTVVEAPIELIDASSRTKRGHTSTTYVFNYNYSVDGEGYTSEYSAVNEKGERYLDDPVITIAYSNTDPAKAGALHVLERQASLGGLIKRMLIIALILGFIAMLVYGWTLPDDDEDEDEAALPEGAKS